MPEHVHRCSVFHDVHHVIWLWHFNALDLFSYDIVGKFGNTENFAGFLNQDFFRYRLGWTDGFAEFIIAAAHPYGVFVLFGAIVTPDVPFSADATADEAAE